MALKCKKNSKAFKAIEVLIKQADKYQAKVGWFKDGGHYPDNGPHVAYVASIQEFGSPANNIPPRPFMRPGLAKSENKLKSIVLSQGKKIIDGNSSPKKIMDLIGEEVESYVYHEITTIKEPKLKDATIQARARRYKSQKGKITETLTKPLIDTKKMLTKLTHVVEKK